MTKTALPILSERTPAVTPSRRSLPRFLGAVIRNPLDALPRDVLAALRDRAVVKLSGGELQARPTSHLSDVEIPEDAEIRRLSAEQSNSSLIIGDAAVLKLVRRVTSGIHPETEMGRFLTENGYANTPALLGEVVRLTADGTPHTLVVVQAFLRNQGDGWQWTLDFLGRAAEAVAYADSTTEDDSEALSPYTAFAGAMGKRLGELHALLAQPTDNADFSPERATAADAKAWAEGARTQLTAAYDAIDAVTSWDNAEVAAAAEFLRTNRAALLKALTGLAAAGKGTLKTRIHGDFHLGQVLVSQGDAFLIDFEGEPAKPLEQRRAKSAPLRDVAGLLRSFDYAAASAAGSFPAAGTRTEGRDALLHRFREAAGSSFLAAYRAVLADAPTPWVTLDAEPALLDLFLIEKAAYEVCYEAANRPTWLGIPLRGLAELARNVLPALPPSEKKETEAAHA